MEEDLFRRVLQSTIQMNLPTLTVLKKAAPQGVSAGLTEINMGWAPFMPQNKVILVL